MRQRRAAVALVAPLVLGPTLRRHAVGALVLPAALENEPLALG